MPAVSKILAFDLGAESGRGILGLFDGHTVQLDVIHRFPNGPVRTLDALHWDVLRLHSEMLTAMQMCAAKVGGVDGRAAVAAVRAANQSWLEERPVLVATAVPA